MKTLALTLGLLLASSHTLAQNPTVDHDSHHTSPAASETTEAEVRKVDKAAKKITLKHGEIKNLDMPPMTMVFQVKDAALLERVQAGDKVRFTADKVGGIYSVTTLQRMEPE